MKQENNIFEEYLVPTKHGLAELIEKKSRFLARVWPVETEQEALSRINEMRQQHWDATHNVYAYIIKEPNIVRYSDDGEPQGTSGLPTLSVFQNEKIENVCCVITRYFGRIQLGAGGLVRAYSKAAKMALDASGISVRRQWHILNVPCQYNLYELIKSEIETFEAFIEDTEFTDTVLMKILVPLKNSEKLQQFLTNLSAGTIEIKIIDTIFLAAKIK